jgi:dTDP-4-dehydrorhamnose reductase
MSSESEFKRTRVLPEAGATTADPLRILVTGGSGYIAQFVLTQFATAFPQAELFTTYCKGGWPRGSTVTGLEMDLASDESIQSVAELARPHVIVHCAAITALAACERDATRADRINVEGSRVLLQAVQALDPKSHFIFLSTDQIYPGGGGVYKEEDDAAEAINVYGRSKRAFEREALKHAGISVLRCSNVFGPASLPFQPLPVGVSKFLQFVISALAEDKEMAMWGNEVCFFSVCDSDTICPRYLGSIYKKKLENQS